jgi:hypothetical protein
MRGFPSGMELCNFKRNRFGARKQEAFAAKTFFQFPRWSAGYRSADSAASNRRHSERGRGPLPNRPDRAGAIGMDLCCDLVFERCGFSDRIHYPPRKSDGGALCPCDSTLVGSRPSTITVGGKTVRVPYRGPRDRSCLSWTRSVFHRRSLVRTPRDCHPSPST